MAFGVMLHALLIYAMFDVHFLTPLVHNIEPTYVNFTAPASRLVIIVADGLRGDRLFELEDVLGEGDIKAARAPRAPFLHSIAKSEGRWGISHARPPTESRPGHVALLAGFYEDPSAITKGWQANAVEFDHLLHQSTAAWAIGAPSLVPMFSTGIPHARTVTYAEELEDFAASSDHAALDVWVFDRAIEILNGEVADEAAKKGATPESERAALEGDRIVFLLHLLGLDSAGHAHKPYGEAYAANVRVVDEGVRRLAAAFEERFGGDENDRGTAFVFTADHGMSNRGAHGDGDPGCTETPLVVWGSGVATAAAAKDVEDGIDPTCRSRGKDAPTPEYAWGLRDDERCDVDQADVAPMGAALLGMPPPMHNTGVLPASYLDPKRRGLRSSAAMSNAAQLLAVYRRKITVVGNKALSAYLTTGGLKPYAPLANADQSLAEIEALQTEGDHVGAVNAARELSHKCVDGLTYLHLYDRGLLQGVVAACFLGWVGYLGAELATMDNDGGGGGGGGRGTSTAAAARTISVTALIVSFVVSAALLQRDAPPTYFAYFNLPVYFGRRCAVIAWKRAVSAPTDSFRAHRKQWIWTVSISLSTWYRWLLVALAAAGLTHILCRSFHERQVYAKLFVAAFLGLVALAMWLMKEGLQAPRRSARAVAASDAARAALVSALAAATLAPFTLLPVELEANTKLVVFGAGCTGVVGLGAHLFLRPLNIFGDDPLDIPHDSARSARRPGFQLLLLQLCLLWTGALVVYVIDGLQDARETIPAELHSIAWILATLAVPLPLQSPPRTLPRFISVYLAAAAVYTLFSVSYESLFYAALGASCLAWLVLERCLQRLSTLGEHRDVPADEVRLVGVTETRAFRVGDSRHAAVFLVLINAAFFSTGNIASVASFEISSVYRFTTRFNPFIMGGLLMLKVLIPMVTVAVAFLALLKLRRAPAFPVYLIFIGLSDLMAARFFFEVTTEGSWQDIGMSISRYALMGTQVVTILIFLGLADVYTRALATNGSKFEVVRKEAKKTR